MEQQHQESDKGTTIYIIPTNFFYFRMASFE